MSGSARKLPQRAGKRGLLTHLDTPSPMRRLLLLMSLTLAFALPAFAQDAPLERITFKPREVVKLRLLPGRPPQGIWQFGNGQYLVTQDADGGHEHEWVRFSLFGEDGEVIRKWELNYGTHGQALFVDRRDDGFLIYTESKNRKGMAIFELSADRTKLKFSQQSHSQG